MAKTRKRRKTRKGTLDKHPEKENKDRRKEGQMTSQEPKEESSRKKRFVVLKSTQ